LLLFTIWWVVLLTTFGSPHVGMPRPAFALLVVAEMAIFGLAVLAHRSAVIVDDRGLTVRDMFRHRRVAWHDVDGVVVELKGAIPGPIAWIKLRAGSRVRTPLWSGGRGSGNRRTREAIDALAAEVRARSCTVEAPPG